MKRRYFNLGVVGFAACLPLAGWANEPVRGNTTEMPFTQIDPPLAGEEKTVRMYFMYTCPYCRQSGELVRWGSTLPKGIRFLETPVVSSREDSIMPGYAFYAAQSVAPDRMIFFNQRVYELVQDQGKSVTDPKTYLLACQDAGINLQKFSQVINTDPIKAKLVEAARLTAASKLIATPSIVAGGRLVVTPEVTGGVNEAFYKLVNAVVSKLIAEGRMV